MPDITCPVCHSVNESTRTFCWKCASDLHAVVPDAATPPPAPRIEVPIQPILIGGGIALAAIALIAVLVVFLGGSPAATTVPSVAPTAAATSTTPGATAAATTAATAEATVEPPTAAPPTPLLQPTPAITPVPKPTIISFTGPATVDCSDPAYEGFITLSWVIDNANSTTLSIDGSGLYQAYPGVQGTDKVPFSCGNGQHTYTLTTVGGAGKAATKTLTIVENSGT